MAITETVSGWPGGAPPTARYPELDELSGVWQRTLLVWTDGRHDSTTEVRWLQAGRWYADLRQPMPRPDFGAVTGLRELDRGQVNWIARQQGFAGQLIVDATDPMRFSWSRMVDIEPFRGTVDTGSLHFEGEVMVERGLTQPYLEHWQLLEQYDPMRSAAVVLRDNETGERGLFLCGADRFAYVRDRPGMVPAAADLFDTVAAAELPDAQDLVDIEISMGVATPDGWRIDRSSLPFREGLLLRVVMVSDDQIQVMQRTDAATSHIRTWSIAEIDGDLGRILSPRGQFA